ncbi:MAG: helix-turn-helix domain-containing protein [Bacteroidota bacterium]
MLYLELPPILQLRPFVDCFWVVEQLQPPFYLQKENVIPDGHPEIIIHYGGRYKVYHKDMPGGEEQPLGILAGQLRGAIQLEPTGASGMIGVRFTPTGFYKLFKQDMHQFVDQTANLSQVLGKWGQCMVDRVNEANSIEERKQVLEALLLERFVEEPLQMSLVDRTLQTIRYNNGNVPIQSIADVEKVSRRHLERRFMAEVGVSPKVYARVVRFNYIFNLLKSDQPLAKTEISYLGGYFDQTHFNKEFKAFSGENPSDYFNRRNQLADFLMSR